MSKGIYLAGAAMVSRQVRQEALVHNLANASTPGYKAARVFADVLKDVDASVDTMRDAESGQEVYVDFSQGPVERTGRDLDLALEGDGFFVVLIPEGERLTRNGNFSLDREGRLVTGQGFPVLTDVGPAVLRHVSLSGSVAVNEVGEIFVGDRIVGRLLLRHFVSPEKLERGSNGLFGVPAGADLEEAEPTARIHQRCLEGSNVLPMDEMVRMMSQLKHYEASQRMVQIQDSALRQTVNDLIRR